ncbi:MAG: phosphopantothenate--cysteine ligase [Firmicutes bacterium HGW-Firmicutes-7]|nr:MAG: phosphopantothenate--cysteine ligase [Firmicutes bacterium HGW-Firmicutes-7]
MINMVITAGGTIEDIDEVRKITNTSTGLLGTFLCDEAIMYMEQNEIIDYRIHYIASTTAIKPELDEEALNRVAFYDVTNTDSVLQVILDIFSKQKIDFFIHCMAVSDFTTKHLIPIHTIAEEISNKLHDAPKENWIELIEDIINNPKETINQEKKVSSKTDLILTLKKTSKIISILKEYNKDLFLVGFKLLKNVSEDELIEAASLLEEKDKCDLVLANDLQSIIEGNHIGLLIKNKEVIGRYEGKKNIAKAIIYQMLKGV